MTYKHPEATPREMNVEGAAASSSSLLWCLQSMGRCCRPVTTGTTLYRDSYMAFMGCSRDAGPMYSQSSPPAPPPDVIDDGIRIAVRGAAPGTVPQAGARSVTGGVISGSVVGDPQFSPPCGTTYRRHHCERVTQPLTSEPAIFYIR
jgi:hypothetical protein